MDAMLIEQVIINLLFNVAIHGKTATKAVLSAGKEGAFVAIKVEDDGNGIEPAVMKHLFDGFGNGKMGQLRGDSVRTMGIGLSVCKTIVTAHGGTLIAGNRPEGGASFTFILPAEE